MVVSTSAPIGSHCEKSPYYPLVSVNPALSDPTAAASEMTTLQQCYSCLSNRERQVMSLVVSGLRNKQVAHELRISEITVKAHRGRMMRKMQAASVAELVTIAAKLHVPQDGLFRQTSILIRSQSTHGERHQSTIATPRKMRHYSLRQLA